MIIIFQVPEVPKTVVSEEKISMAVPKRKAPPPEKGTQAQSLLRRDRVLTIFTLVLIFNTRLSMAVFPPFLQIQWRV